MTREVRTHCIVLCVRKTGENNQTITLLSSEHGIVYATLYGGPKSRLRGKVSVWHSGEASLYLSRAKQMDSGVKITDFAVASFHASFREYIYKDFAASIAAETVIDTKCAGNAVGCYALVSAFLDGLEATTEEGAMRAALVRFLWRYLALLGVQCDASKCAICGGSTAAGAVYDSEEDGFICTKCLEENSADSISMNGNEASAIMRVGSQGIRYLDAVARERPVISRAMPVSGQTLRELTALTFMLIQKAVGHPLRSIQSGVGIL